MVSSAVKRSAAFGVEYRKIKQNKEAYSELSQAEKKAMLSLVHESLPELNGIKADLDLAVLKLDNLKYHGVLKIAREEIEEVKNELNHVRDLVEKAIPTTNILLELLGYPQKSTFLVMIQNNDELRPTGGFMGNYGILETIYGDISRYDTHDIYHMDIPLEKTFKIEPPVALKKYLGVNNWYLRDSNWSPDFKEAAQKIEWFFWQEDKLLPEKNKLNNLEELDEEFDGVIAITPRFITDLLYFIGPIEVDGKEYGYKNFAEVLEHEVEKDYYLKGIREWDRKAVIGDISKKMKEIIFDKPINELMQIAMIVSDNLDKKNVLFFFKNDESQAIAKENNWSGELKQTDDDYIYVVDANMAALKTDSVVSRKMNYKLERSVNGLFSHLDLTYAHEGGVDWRTSAYRTYTRIYLPLASEIISVEGFKSDYQFYEELGKSVLAGFLEVAPGKISDLKIYYKLPDKIFKKYDEGIYSLYIQKQPGKNVEPLIVNIETKNKAKNFLPTGFFVKRLDDEIQWTSDLEFDREFIINFK
jgi:hypothetical protein